MIHSNDQYGATHQSTPRAFVGSEGQQAAMVLRKQILIKMGKNNSARFLTTKLSEVLKEIDELARPEAGGTLSIKDKLSIQEAKKKLKLSVPSGGAVGRSFRIWGISSALA